MHLKYIVSLSATILMIAYPAMAQEATETQASFLKIPAKVNPNITDKENRKESIPKSDNELIPSFPSSCNSQVCLFTLIRNSSHNSFEETEFVGGLIWQLGGSSKDTEAEAKKLLAVAQKDKLDQESTLILTDKLADAMVARIPEQKPTVANR